MMQYFYLIPFQNSGRNITKNILENNLRRKDFCNLLIIH